MHEAFSYCVPAVVGGIKGVLEGRRPRGVEEPTDNEVVAVEDGPVEARMLLLQPKYEALSY